MNLLSILMRKAVGPVVALTLVLTVALTATAPVSARSTATDGIQAKLSATDLPRLAHSEAMTSPDLLLCDGFDPVDPITGGIFTYYFNPFDYDTEYDLWFWYEYWWSILNGQP